MLLQDISQMSNENEKIQSTCALYTTEIIFILAHAVFLDIFLTNILASEPAKYVTQQIMYTQKLC